METNTFELLEYAREIAKQAEEIGRLKVLNEIKDRTIEGLKAGLGLGVLSAKPLDLSTPSVPTTPPMSPFYGPYCTSGYMRPVDDSDIMLASAKSNLESTISSMAVTPSEGTLTVSVEAPSEEEAPKRKCGRPKGSKNSKKSVSTSVVAESVETSVGGSVFKEFTPLSTSNLVTPNANAYIPKQKQDSVFSIVS